MKKIIAVILTFAVCFAAFCIPASAASHKVKVYPRYLNGYTYAGIKTLGNTVYYTTDGSRPDRKATKYTTSILVTEPTTIRMAVYSKGKVVGRYRADIKVMTEMPDIAVKVSEKGEYVATITVPEGAAVYYSTNGNTPSKSKKNKLTETTDITVEPGTRISAKATRKGWKDSFIAYENVPATAPEIVEPEAPAPEPTKEELFLKKLTELINEERQKFHFDDIKADAALIKAAQTRAEELVSDYNICRPDGRNFDSVFSEQGILFTSTSQSIAKNFSTAEEAFEYWKSMDNVSRYFDNSEFNRIGLGYVESEDGSENYWVLLLIQAPNTL